jgi:hypothetical protein
MEKARAEYEYSKTAEETDVSKREIEDFLEREQIYDPADKLRLTRVLQLVERYSPDRKSKDPEGRWLRMLESLRRLLPEKKKEKRRLSPEKISPQAYLLAEDAIRDLRNLRHLDKELAKQALPDAAYVEQQRPEKVSGHETFDTSLTLEYEKDQWGVERICLDGVQNHLPADSKGERVWVRGLVGGEWVPLSTAAANPKQVKAVRFIDDGVGFDVRHLSLLYSTKNREQESAGQFGEGMKMVAAASLREGLDLEYESQNWRAKPQANKIQIQNTRSKKTEAIDQLAFAVDRLDGPAMAGSRTTVWKPNEAFMREAMQLDKKVLGLRENYHPLFVDSAGEIVDREPGRIFVKGISVMERDALFSYNFTDVKTNRDRNVITTENWERRVATILGNLSDKGLVKTLLSKSLINPSALECGVYGVWEPKHPTVWRDAFYEIFGKEAVVDTGYQIPEAFSQLPLKKVKFPSTIQGILLHSKVKTDREFVPDSYDETVSTSLTLDYGKRVWNNERMLLDVAQNHLPRDSGGSSLGMRFRTRDGKWHDYAELKGVADDQIDAIKLFDDGRGYDYRMLGLLYSTKGGQEAGGFGEGLKMASAAALREGMRLELRSQNWAAVPQVKQQTIDGRNISQMEYVVTHGVKNRPPVDDDVHWRSSTTFFDPTSALLSEYRGINSKILDADKTKPYESTPSGDIVNLSGGLLFVRQLLIPGRHDLLFSYHLRNYEIKNRDRNVVPRDELSREVSGVLSDVKNPEVIRQFLFKAEKNVQAGAGEIEFGTYFSPRYPEVWKKVFQEMYGTETAIRDAQAQEFEGVDVGQNTHVGLDTVTLPSKVYASLLGIGLPNYVDRVREMTHVNIVPDEQISPEEKRLLEFLRTLDRFLPGNRPSEIHIYEKKDPDQRVALGFARGGNVFLFRQAVRESLEQAAFVYFHEKTHVNTQGAKDAAPEFRDYSTLTSTKMALALIKEKQPELFEELETPLDKMAATA